MTMKKYYVIRRGWNEANQSARNSARNPRNQFESRELQLVAIIEATSEESAVCLANVIAYPGQVVFTETNPRAIKGLTQAIRNFMAE
jgi:hypothetical protein